MYGTLSARYCQDFCIENQAPGLDDGDISIDFERMKSASRLLPLRIKAFRIELPLGRLERSYWEMPEDVPVLIEEALFLKRETKRGLALYLNRPQSNAYDNFKKHRIYTESAAETLGVDM